jgi:biopolymer transport protein ExbD
MKKLQRITQRETEITTASTSDIAFLLIVFFMLTTVFRTEMGLKITLPTAQATERIMKRRNVSHVWLDKTGRTSINDNLLDANGVISVARSKLDDNPDLIMVVRADQDVEYGKVTDVLESLKEAGTLKITFATEFEMK